MTKASLLRLVHIGAPADPEAAVVVQVVEAPQEDEAWVRFPGWHHVNNAVYTHMKRDTGSAVVAYLLADKKAYST